MDKMQQLAKDSIKNSKTQPLGQSREGVGSWFEGVQNCSTLYQIQRKIFDFATYGFVLSLLLNLLQFFAIFFVLLPLKEKEPYLVSFSNQEQNFAIVQKADFSITANDALKRQLVGSYILAREGINRIDDRGKWELVRLQSEHNVWKQFEAIVADQNSIYTNESLTRKVRIINISLKNKTYATAEVEITLAQNEQIQSIKRYVIALIYGFESLNFDFKSLPLNPTGFKVKRYSISEMEVLKELPPQNQVQRQSLQSKITPKESQTSILEDAYLFQRNPEIPHLSPLKEVK